MSSHHIEVVMDDLHSRHCISRCKETFLHLVHIFSTFTIEMCFLQAILITSQSVNTYLHIFLICNFAIAFLTFAILLLVFGCFWLSACCSWSPLKQDERFLRTICMKATHVCHLDRNQASQLLCQDSCPKFGVLSHGKLRNLLFTPCFFRDFSTTVCFRDQDVDSVVSLLVGFMGDPNHKASCAKESLRSIRCNQQGVVDQGTCFKMTMESSTRQRWVGPRGAGAIIFTASQARKKTGKNCYFGLVMLQHFRGFGVVGGLQLPQDHQPLSGCPLAIHLFKPTRLTHEKMHACDDMARHYRIKDLFPSFLRPRLLQFDNNRFNKCQSKSFAVQQLHFQDRMFVNCLSMQWSSNAHDIAFPTECLASCTPTSLESCCTDGFSCRICLRTLATQEIFTDMLWSRVARYYFLIGKLDKQRSDLC